MQQDIKKNLRKREKYKLCEKEDYNTANEGIRLNQKQPRESENQVKGREGVVKYIHNLSGFSEF